MSIKGQIVVITSCFLIFLGFIRNFLYGVKRYQLNNSAYKKRKKDESVKEWLLYTRYRNEIPKPLLALYFYILLIHPIGLSCCIILYFINLSYNIGETVAVVIACLDVAISLLLSVLFWSPGKEYAYGRWIAKR